MQGTLLGTGHSVVDKKTKLLLSWRKYSRRTQSYPIIDIHVGEGRPF